MHSRRTGSNDNAIQSIFFNGVLNQCLSRIGTHIFIINGIGNAFHFFCRLGQAASAAAILLASGTKGKRLMLPNARVLIHQPAIDQGFGKATEIEIQAKEMLRMREWLEETLAKHTGQDVEKIRRDIEVDTFLTAPEAKEYGIVDEVLEHRQ